MLVFPKVTDIIYINQFLLERRKLRSIQNTKGKE